MVVLYRKNDTAYVMLFLWQAARARRAGASLQEQFFYNAGRASATAWGRSRLFVDCASGPWYKMAAQGHEVTLEKKYPNRYVCNEIQRWYLVVLEM